MSTERSPGEAFPKAPTPSSKLRGTAAAPLLYWLLLVSGLAAFTVLRIDELDKVAPLWVGTVVGAGLGMLLAWRRIRLWLVGFFLLNAMWVLPLMVLPLLARRSDAPWDDVQTALMAFAPAGLCAYLSLSERAALASFWFPASLWMLAILDRSPALGSGESWALLGALAVLFVAYLRARETRRAAIWQRHAAVRLAAPNGAAVLRRAPLRLAAQLAWALSLGAASLALTAWIAPHLWQNEKLPAHAVATTREAALAANPYAWGNGEMCCPDEQTVVDVQRRRVKEYLPLLRAHDEAPPPALPAQCLACRDGVPIRVGVGHGPVAYGVSSTRGSHVRPAQGTAVPGYGPLGGAASPSPPPTEPAVETPYLDPTSPSAPPLEATPPAPPRAPIARTPEPPPPPTPAAPSRVVTVPPGVAHRPLSLPPPPVAARAQGGGLNPAAWLLTFAIVTLALHAAMRPLRRLLTVRHLGQPLWPEAVDQRVSNLWQLALVGLRDAGWHAVPGEQPGDLARRVGLEGLETCAKVLERVRHGVRVDAEDLDAMTRAARSVYTASRRGAGWAARASSWVRWPLA